MCVNAEKKIIGTMLCAALLFTGCGSTPEAVEQSIAVNAVSIERGALKTEGTYIGTVKDANETMVIPMVSAKVLELKVNVGDVVSSGDVLCKLDDTAGQLQLDSAKASLNSAQASYNSAIAQTDAQMGGQKSLQDYSTNYNINSMEQKLDDVKDDIDDIKSNLKKVKAAMEAAESEMLAAKTAADLAPGDEGAAAAAENAELKYNKLKEQYNSLNSSLSALKESRKTLEDNINQAYGSKEISDTEVLSDTQKVIDASKNAARAGVSSAQVGVESAQYQLEFYTLKAPISGVVSAVNVSENNYCSQGSASFVISSAEAKEVVFYVPDNVKNELVMGQQVTIHSDSTEYQGNIKEIGVKIDAQTGLFVVKAEIFHADDLAVGGRVELITTSHAVEDAYLIPTDALYFESGRPYIYVVSENIAKMVPVEIELYTSETVAISGALDPGEQVITSWSSYLRDGMQVQVMEAQGQHEEAE